MWGNHLFELFRAQNAEKVILPHLGSSLWALPCTPGRESFFELFRAENAEKVIPPHLGSSLTPEPGVGDWIAGTRCGGIIFELFMPKKVIFPHLGSLNPWSRVRESLSFSRLLPVPLRNHFFELFRASPLSAPLDRPVCGNHLFELFRAENFEKVIPPPP